MSHTPDSDSGADKPTRDSLPQEGVRRKRIRHAWEEAPHAHDQMMVWVGRLLGMVLIGIILYLGVRAGLTSMGWF